MASITYSNRSSLNRHILPTLALGWITYPEEGEVLWAQMPDGRLLQSEVLKVGQPYFFVKHRTWTEVDAIPDHAEYCGQYLED